ncbi:MAG: inorganic phosphate transporter [Planctomycetes bacterium]|nr:inorganic phosphate transporter [Planctomycetota bacterium]
MHFFDTVWKNLFVLDYTSLGAVVLLLIGLALVFDYLNGLHDAANSIATVVSTRVLTPQQAVLWAAFFNFIAFLFFNLKVAGTIGRGIIEPSAVSNSVIAGTLIGACAWNILTWYWGLPTSSSHALIGGLVGAALVHSGWSSLLWGGIASTCAFIVIAPMLGLVIGLGIVVAVYWTVHWLEAKPRTVDVLFRRGQLVSAALYSLGHGGNDAQKTMGIILVLLIAATAVDSKLEWRDRYHLDSETIEEISKDKKKAIPVEILPKLKQIIVATDEAEETAKAKRFSLLTAFEEKAHALLTDTEWERHKERIIKAADHSEVPTEVVLMCHLAMGAGTLMGGWRIVKTMGQRIIRLRPVDGFCAETGAAVTLVLTLFGGIPVSTTHTITGSIVGVGSVQRLSAVRWGVAERVVWAWVFTIPGAAIVSALCVFLWEYIEKM